MNSTTTSEYQYCAVEEVIKKIGNLYATHKLHEHSCESRNVHKFLMSLDALA